MTTITVVGTGAALIKMASMHAATTMDAMQTVTPDHIHVIAAAVKEMDSALVKP